MPYIDLIFKCNTYCSERCKSLAQGAVGAHRAQLLVLGMTFSKVNAFYGVSPQYHR